MHEWFHTKYTQYTQYTKYVLDTGYASHFF
jgi:hypothetical protein